jgi:hypothetical protein
LELDFLRRAARFGSVSAALVLFEAHPPGFGRAILETLERGLRGGAMGALTIDEVARAFGWPDDARRRLTHASLRAGATWSITYEAVLVASSGHVAAAIAMCDAAVSRGYAGDFEGIAEVLRRGGMGRTREQFHDMAEGAGLRYAAYLLGRPHPFEDRLRLLEAPSDDPRIMTMRGRLLNWMAKYAEAAHVLKRAVRAAYRDAYWQLGFAELCLGHSDAARDALRAGSVTEICDTPPRHSRSCCWTAEGIRKKHERCFESTRGSTRARSRRGTPSRRRFSGTRGTRGSRSRTRAARPATRAGRT